MNKKLTTLLLTSSVLALATLHPVSADGTTTNTEANTAATTAAKKYKEIHYVTFGNRGMQEIKETLKGDAAANAGETPPDIAGYRVDQMGMFSTILIH